MSNVTASRRKFAPKGRGGCNTCKLRRVRCDKQKPTCTPCSKSCRQCEYSADPVRSDPDQLKVVLWKPNNLSLQRVSPGPCQSREEVRAFDFFRSKVATCLGGFFDSGFWSRDILRAAQHESTIRNAIVALAALSETMLKTGPAFDKGSKPLEAFVLRQHTKAISDLNQKLQDNTDSSFEVVLATCILLICFEMFQNHHESALRQMSSGIHMFGEWQSKYSRDAKAASLCLPGNCSELVVQLTHIFRRLMLQTLLFPDTHLIDRRVLTPEFTPTMPSVPSAFTSIDEARDCLNSCMCSTIHGSLASQFQDVGRNEMYLEPARPIFRLSGAPLHEWSQSFKAFMGNLKTRLSSREQQAGTILEMQHLTGTILASAGVFTDETVFDSFEDRFSLIIALASRLIGTTGGFPHDLDPSCPAFDMGIIPPIYFVASRCRHPLIRRQALHLLRKGPQQEGVWHSVMLSNIAERIMTIEEMDIAGARSSVDIPATARLSVLNATIHSAQRRVVLHCCRQQFDVWGKAHVLHELVEY